jgi:hypothetical protein
MVLPAQAALTMTNTAVTNTNNAELQLEVNNAQSRINYAISVGSFSIEYNALILGNPNFDPRLYFNSLSILQQQFYTAFIQVGYIVDWDTNTGFWTITWAPTGPETLVLIYSFRVSIDPSAFTAQTITSIQNFFTALVPTVHTVVIYNGFIGESSFGAPTSTFYEFTTIAGQYSDQTNHATALAGYMTTTGLGYNSGNSNVFLLAPTS